MSKKLTAILYWGLIGAALLLLAMQMIPSLVDFVSTEVRAMRYPYSIDYGEGPLLDQTLRLARFENIYRSSFDAPPYTISNYPPLFILLQVPFAWLFGPAFWYGRLIAFLSALLAGLFVGLTLKTLTRSWLAGLVGGLLLVIMPYVQHWSKFNRIDGLALAFSWAALYVTVRFYRQAGGEGPDWRQVARRLLRARSFWVALALFVAAIYTRQTYALAAPFAALCWLVFGTAGSKAQRLARAGLLGVGVGGLAVVLFLALNLATRGGFYLNIVVANVNAFYWNTVEHFANEILDRLWGLLLLVIAFSIFSALRGPLARRGEPAGAGDGTWALVLPYLFAAALGSVTIGKDGSSVNYLFEFSAALSLVSGAMLAWAGQRERRWLRLLVQLLVIGVLIGQVAENADWVRNDSVAYMNYREGHQQDIAAVLQILKETPGPVLADEYMGLVPLAGKGLAFQPFEYKQMAEGRVWDEAPFLSSLREHQFGVILWYQPRSWRGSIEARWTKAQRSVIEKEYQIDRIVGDVYVYRPKK